MSAVPSIPAPLRERFDALRAQYPAEMASSLVLPLLHCTQQDKGWLSEADAVMIAQYIPVPAMQVLEALRWYTMFHQAPQGRHVIKVCRNIACALRGSEDLLTHLQRKLAINVGQTTPDGRYTLQTVECLASCGTAPAMQVNDTYHEHLDAQRIDHILGDLP
jgi:NADH-quinone oxidoreductase subunit E